jgi:hypothetical protein
MKRRKKKTKGFGMLKGKKLKPFVREHNFLDREFE